MSETEDEIDLIDNNLILQVRAQNDIECDVFATVDLAIRTKSTQIQEKKLIKLQKEFKFIYISKIHTYKREIENKLDSLVRKQYSSNSSQSIILNGRIEIAKVLMKDLNDEIQATKGIIESNIAGGCNN